MCRRSASPIVLLIFIAWTAVTWRQRSIATALWVLSLIQPCWALRMCWASNHCARGFADLWFLSLTSKFCVGSRNSVPPKQLRSHTFQMGYVAVWFPAHVVKNTQLFSCFLDSNLCLLTHCDLCLWSSFPCNRKGVTFHVGSLVCSHVSSYWGYSLARPWNELKVVRYSSCSISMWWTWRLQLICSKEKNPLSMYALIFAICLSSFILVFTGDGPEIPKLYPLKLGPSCSVEFASVTAKMGAHLLQNLSLAKHAAEYFPSFFLWGWHYSSCSSIFLFSDIAAEWWSWIAAVRGQRRWQRSLLCGILDRKSVV